MASHDLGDVVRVTGTWTDSDSVATDPASVFCKIRDPNRNITSYEYGEDAELVKSATGVYYVDVDADKEGTYFYRFYSTGAGKAAEESSFSIVESEF